MDGDGLSRLSDDELVEALRQSGGKPHAEELMRRVRPRVLRHCTRVLGERSAAEDAAQDTCMRVLDKLRLYRPGNFQAWIHTMARRCSLNYMKQALGAESVGDGIEEAASGVDLEAGLASAQERQRVLEVLQTLPQAQRLCLKLLYMEQMAYDDIARHTGWPLKTVKSHLQNGRLRFEREWRKRYGPL